MVKEKKTVKEETVKKEKTKKVKEEVVENTKQKVKTDKKTTKKADSKKKEKNISVNKTTLKGEFKKIKWPTKKEMIKYSIAVIVFIVFCALFFNIIQLIMGGLLELK